MVKYYIFINNKIVKFKFIIVYFYLVKFIIFLKLLKFLLFSLLLLFKM